MQTNWDKLKFNWWLDFPKPRILTKRWRVSPWRIANSPVVFKIDASDTSKQSLLFLFVLVEAVEPFPNWIDKTNFWKMIFFLWWKKVRYPNFELCFAIVELVLCLSLKRLMKLILGSGHSKQPTTVVTTIESSWVFVSLPVCTSPLLKFFVPFPDSPNDATQPNLLHISHSDVTLHLG